MKSEGYGAGYAYDHDEPDAFSGQNYWPEALGRQKLYEPVERGFEREILQAAGLLGKAAEGARGVLSAVIETAPPNRRMTPGPALAIESHAGLSSRFPRRRARRLLRHTVNLLAARLWGTNFPWGTFLINISGSLVMGLIAGFLAFRAGANWTQHVRLFLLTGILGGYTTFSAFSLDAALLFERGELGCWRRPMSAARSSGAGRRFRRLCPRGEGASIRCKQGPAGAATAAQDAAAAKKRLPPPKSRRATATRAPGQKFAADARRSAVQNLVVTEDEDGMRIDRWFKRRIPTLSLVASGENLPQGRGAADGKRVDTSTRVVAGPMCACRR